MLEGIKALINSEKAIAGGMLVIAATVLVITGNMPLAEWEAYTKFVFAVYVGGKAIQGTASAIANGKVAVASIAAGAASKDMTPAEVSEAIKAQTETKAETKTEAKTDA